MKKLRIGVIDLVSQGPTKSLWSRVMNANLASIMPQVIAVWCKRQGHDVSFLCYTGFEDLTRVLPANLDLVFIGAFTESAQLAWYRRSPQSVVAAELYQDDRGLVSAQRSRQAAQSAGGVCRR